MITVLATIFVLGILIFFHELGHFLVAKRSGIKVDKFSLGFPPTILSKKWGETVYAIGLIPLGGYVKMAGEIRLMKPAGSPGNSCPSRFGNDFLLFLPGRLRIFFSP